MLTHFKSYITYKVVFFIFKKNWFCTSIKMLVVVKVTFLYLLGFSLTKYNAVHCQSNSDDDVVQTVSGPNVCKRIEEWVNWNDVFNAV